MCIRDRQKPEYKNNPAFGDPSHHSNAKNRTEEKIDEFVNIKWDPKGAKEKRDKLTNDGKRDHTIWKPGFDAGLSKDVDITKDGPGKVLKQVGQDKVVKPIVDKGKEIVGNAANKITSGAKTAIGAAGKAASSKIGKSILGGAAIIGGATLAAKALKNRKEKKAKKEKEKVKSEQVTFQQFQEKCWAGYEKKGMKTMFGKRYPNCVKKKK